MNFITMIINWIFQAILSPIFEFIAKILSPVVSWIFDKVLGPLITKIAEPVIKFVFEQVLMKFLAGILYTILYRVLRLVDVAQEAFDILIGLTPVTYKGEEMRLINVLFNDPKIFRVLLMVTLLGITLAGGFTVFGVIRSMFDFDFENKRPVSAVLGSFLKAMGNFIVVPFFVWFVVSLSAALLGGVDTALTGGERTTFGATVFLITTFDAAKSPGHNGANADLYDEVRRPYLDGTRQYDNYSHVTTDFNVTKIDFVTGYIAAVFMLIILAMCLVLFVQRIFEVLVMYLMAPLFVSVMPLDDGEKFGKWREMFLGKAFMGFGSAIGMRLYLMVLPKVMSSSLFFRYNDRFLGTQTGDGLFNYAVKLIFLLGGAFAVYKSSSLLTSIVSAPAASHEDSSAASIGGLASGAMLAGAAAIAPIGSKTLMGQAMGQMGLSSYYQSYGQERDALTQQYTEELRGRVMGKSNYTIPGMMGQFGREWLLGSSSLQSRAAVGGAFGGGVGSTTGNAFGGGNAMPGGVPGAILLSGGGPTGTPGKIPLFVPVGTPAGKPGASIAFDGTPGGIPTGTPETGNAFSGTPGGIPTGTSATDNAISGTLGGTLGGTLTGTPTGAPATGTAFSGTPGGIPSGTPIETPATVAAFGGASVDTPAKSHATSGGFTGSPSGTPTATDTGSAFTGAKGSVTGAPPSAGNAYNGTASGATVQAVGGSEADRKRNTQQKPQKSATQIKGGPELSKDMFKLRDNPPGKPGNKK